VRSEIERRLGAPVILENDANVAASEKSGWEPDAMWADMAMLTLGTGVGGGIVAGWKNLAWHDRHGW